MYVDHASCSSCGARFQPEAIGSGGRCPSCGTTLGIKDLFGVADHLVEETPENVSFDDLVSKPSGPSRGRAPQPSAARPSAARPSTSEDQGISNIFAALDEIRRGRGG